MLINLRITGDAYWEEMLKVIRKIKIKAFFSLKTDEVDDISNKSNIFKNKSKNIKNQHKK